MDPGPPLAGRRPCHPRRASKSEGPSSSPLDNSAASPTPCRARRSSSRRTSRARPHYRPPAACGKRGRVPPRPAGTSAARPGPAPGSTLRPRQENVEALEHAPGRSEAAEPWSCRSTRSRNSGSNAGQNTRFGAGRPTRGSTPARPRRQGAGRAAGPRPRGRAACRRCGRRSRPGCRSRTKPEWAPQEMARCTPRCRSPPYYCSTAWRRPPELSASPQSASPASPSNPVASGACRRVPRPTPPRGSRAGPERPAGRTPPPTPARGRCTAAPGRRRALRWRPPRPPSSRKASAQRSSRSSGCAGSPSW
mmetsp:Transcript_48305/g.139938  ORF Transcript_48305/g.139938 Transcript_48305/m.139938 type:complete len:307 (+) Transcript_48305:1083-2003(+)